MAAGVITFRGTAMDIVMDTVIDANIDSSAHVVLRHDISVMAGLGAGCLYGHIGVP